MNFSLFRGVFNIFLSIMEFDSGMLQKINFKRKAILFAAIYKMKIFFMAEGDAN